MLQADKRFLAYRSLALSSKRAAAERGNSHQLLVAIAALKEALGSAEGMIKEDVLTRFWQQLTESQLDLKQRRQAELTAAETLQDRESALREMLEAKGKSCVCWPPTNASAEATVPFCSSDQEGTGPVEPTACGKLVKTCVL